MKALILVALTGIAVATAGAANAAPIDNSLMVHGYLGTAYGK